MGGSAHDQVPQAPSDEELLRVIQSRPREDPERQSACETLVTRYSSIVRSCVQHYWRFPEPEDLTQVGYVGLLKAINKFDPDVGDNLAAYAQPCVSGEIKRYFRDKRWQMRVHRQAQEMRLAIRAASGELTQQLARAPRDSELADHLGVPEPEITAAQAASQAFQVASLDAPLTEDDDGQLGDLIGAEDPQLEQAVDMASVWKHCDELPRRQQRLLMMRFYGNMTQAQIGEELGISQMHVSRLLQRALTYLRQKIADSKPDPVLGTAPAAAWVGRRIRGRVGQPPERAADGRHDMDRASSKHGPWKDDQMERETHDIGHAGEPHLQEWRQTEPFDEEFYQLPEAETPGTPAGMTHADVDRRSDIAIYLPPGKLPADRDKILGYVRRAGATDDVLDALGNLPPHREFRTIGEVVRAIGIPTEEPRDRGEGEE